MMMMMNRCYILMPKKLMTICIKVKSFWKVIVINDYNLHLVLFDF